MKNTNPILLASKKSGKSVEEIMKQLEFSEADFELCDGDPDEIPGRIYKEISRLTGVSRSALEPKEDIVCPKIKESYQEKTAPILQALELKQESLDRLLDEYEEYNDEDIKKILNDVADSFKNMTKDAKIFIRKPVVCAFGKFNSGKSTLANYLIGEDIARTAYTPETTERVFYYHLSDMPEKLKEKGGTAFVFGQVFGEDSPEKAGKFDHEDLFDEDKEVGSLLFSGDLNEVIDYSAKTGKNFKSGIYDIFEIDIFLDVPILKELTFVDVPGFGSGMGRDDEVSLSMTEGNVDIVFYLSQTTCFMEGEDFIHLSNVIKTRLSTENVFVLATAADNVESINEVKNVLESGYERFINVLSDDTKKRIGKKEIESFRKHFIAFDIRSRNYCNDLNAELEKFVPKFIESRIKIETERIANECDRQNLYYSEERRRILESRSPEKKNKEREEKFIEERKADLRTGRAELKNAVEDHRKSSISRFKKEYAELMEPDNIVGLLEKKGIKNKKQEIELFSVYLSNEIGERLSSALEDEGKAYNDQLNDFLRRYEEGWNKRETIEKLGVDFSGFDVKRAFAAGLAGVGTYGALAVWAAIVAGGSNLGGYILVAKVVSALAGMGISLGGTSAVSSAVAALGGPVTIGIALAAIAVGGVLALNQTIWKPRLAKALNKSYAKQGFAEKNIEQINKYWNDTIEATEKCLTHLENDSLDYYRSHNALMIRLEEDREISDKIKYIYYTVSRIYRDLQYRVTLDKKRDSDNSYNEQLDDIFEEATQINKENHRLKLIVSDKKDLKSIVFMNAKTRVDFWNDIAAALDDDVQDAIDLTSGCHILKRKDKYSILYKKSAEEIVLKCLDGYISDSDLYSIYSEKISGESKMMNDQIRYKLFDMIERAKKEIRILVPWINSYGWETEREYGKSIESAIREQLEKNKNLYVKIWVGYDLEHPDSRKEKETRDYAQKVRDRFAEYDQRFEIITETYTHIKIVYVDGVCSLNGSFNILSNDGPWEKRDWPSETMAFKEELSDVKKDMGVIEDALKESGRIRRSKVK